MKILKYYFVFIFLFLGTSVFALDFTVMSPTSGQILREGDTAYIRWQGDINSSSYGTSGYANYGVGTVSPKVLKLSVYPGTYYGYVDYGSGGNNYVDIGTVDAHASIFSWTVPKGFVSYFKGQSDFRISFSGGSFQKYSPVFSIAGSTSTPPMSIKSISGNNVQCAISTDKVFLGKPVTYSASVSLDKGPYDFDWIGKVANANHPTLTVVYPSIGVYNVSLRVTDNTYLTWTADCGQVEVVNVATSTDKINTFNNTGYGYSASTTGISNYNSVQGYALPNADRAGYESVSKGHAKKANATSTIGVSSATSSTLSCLSLSDDLFLGVEDMGDSITSLQLYLTSQNLFDYSATGFFGLHTKAAVQKFQSANGVNATGYVGPLTRAKIKELTCK